MSIMYRLGFPAILQAMKRKAMQQHWKARFWRKRNEASEDDAKAKKEQADLAAERWAKPLKFTEDLALGCSS